jgi:hypothetical protein
MNEIKDLIEKTINPPGITNKNRRSIFEAIRAVADMVKKDARKAFDAHFPYLSDTAKLEEHGNALLVPRLLDDTEKEYRDRVSTASYFLTRSGERGYIIGQLNAHFGDRYVASDEFLEVYVKVRDLADSDRHWLLQFLDELINPNVKLSVAEWFHFVDKVILREVLTAQAGMALRDTFNDRSVKLNGGIKLDGRTKNDTVKLRPKLNGYVKLSGEIKLSGALLSLPATDYARLPVRLGRGVLDKLNISVNPAHRDIYTARIKLRGAVKLDGTEKLSGYGRVNDKPDMRLDMNITSAFLNITETVKTAVKPVCKDNYQFPFKLAGFSRLDGGVKLTGKKDVVERLEMNAKTGFYDRYTARLRLNGAVKLNSAERLTGYAGVNDRLHTGLRYCRKLDGQYTLNGNIKLNSGILIAA